ncbi:MAG: fibronectin type III domain-containing protein, partial [Acidimicrobiales bacterium]
MAVIALVVSLVVTLGVTTVSTASSASAAPTARPGVPTKVSAAAGNGQATVSFGAPKDTGGQPITSYTVTATNQANPNASPVQVVGKTSPIMVKGMVNGVVWTITVAASNAAGQGPATNSSSVVIPTNHPELTPDPPTNVTAKAAPGQATVSYTPPAKDNPAAPVYLYVATATDLTDPSKGGQTGIVDFAGKTGSGPITVTGLTNGDLYTFTVISGNTGINLPDEPTQGSVPSDPSAPVMPAAPSRPPGPPTKVSATAGNGEASVSFSAPEDNGGQPITSYTVTASSGLQVSGTTSPIIVLGLADRTTYTFTVTATNLVGTGPASVPSNPVVPSGPPGAPPGVPTKVSAAAGNSQATVSFSPPSATGGTPITFYTVTATNQANPNASPVQVVGKTSPIMVKG